MLRFVETNKPQTVDFSDILYGRLFKHNGSVYIALNENNDLLVWENDGTHDGIKIKIEHYAVNLETGELVFFNWNEKVIPIEGTLTYERI